MNMTLTNLLIEKVLPEYRGRHIFATKLRLAAFLGFWLIFLYFLRDVLGQTKAVAGIILVAFFVTWFAYYNVMRGKWLLLSFVLELICDLTSITVIIYLTGGPYSPYYTIFIIYVFIAGVLYTHYLAGIMAICSAAFYLLFIELCGSGVIPPLMLDYGDRLPIPAYSPLAHFLFALLFLCGIVYTVKVASYFSQQRERILERRNRELTALHRMSSTVRSAKILRELIEQLLEGVLEGLNFQTVILIHFDWSRSRAILHVSRRTPRLNEIERVLGRHVDGTELSLSELPRVMMQEIMRHRIIFRRELSELIEGADNSISREQCRQMQEILGAKRIVVMPIVVESEALGALIGFSREQFVEEEQVATMESFSNQSALLFEAATLIDRLRRVNVDLKEANRVKSEFLATMSHELRTPLTAIIGFSELLMEGVMGELTEEQKDSLREVLHNAADLLELINSLLDLTKIESGKMRLDINSFDVGDAVAGACSTISPLVQKKGQKLEMVKSEHPLTIEGDGRKIGQVILNLLANANKFTHEGGNIKVSMERFNSVSDVKALSWWHRIEDIGESIVDGCVKIVVSDDGIGIREEQMALVFEMFHQVDRGASRSFGGTGVGLALARKFVEMHGGRIWVESEFGKGARFTVILLVKAPAGDYFYE